MGRYRAPAPKSAPYITHEGYQRLELELNALWKRRAEVTKALSAAAAEGDRSDNAEYIYRKKELREIDRRIRYLQKRVPELIQVNSAPSDPSKVFFGAWIELENELGERLQYRIVGADEIGIDPRYISMDAPLAKGLFKHQADDEIHIQSPKGELIYSIISICYKN